MTTKRRALRSAAVLVTLAATAAAGSVLATGAQADTPAVGSSTSHGKTYGGKGHVIGGPFSQQMEQQRKTALEQVLSGKSKVVKRDGSQVVKLGKDKYVELGRERTDKIFTILTEFGDKVDNTTLVDRADDDTPDLKPKYGGTPGPLHNQIAEPDRAKNNSTAWQKDYSSKHFQDLYFGSGKGVDSLKTYYEKTSSGRYSVDGEVSDWVKVPYNEARYGSNYCGADNCPNVEDLVRDGVTAWVEQQKAAGKSDADIKADLSQYDQWDRTDHDNDGNFNEPDGYIDHFQIVHAGEDGSAGGGAQGGDSLWAHRGYAYGRDDGDTGPTGFKAGGTPVGDTGIWVGDYTMQPENGGLGVFAHEYGHDLGLPDLYDTTYSGENSVGFWSLMSAGSWLGTGKDSIGDMPGDMTAWDKLQLGWLDYDKAKAATKSTHTLGVSEYNTKRKQALVVELPEKKNVTTEIVKPTEGAKQWWSDYGDDLSNTLTRPVDLTGRSKAALELDGWYDIEKDYDYLYTQVSTDDGASWKTIDGTADGVTIPRDGGDKPALTGVSGKFQHLVFPLDAYAGKKISVRFRYKTDGGAGGMGFTADNLTVKADGQALFTDNAEGDDNGWTARGFSRVGASVTGDFPQFYLAENRQYVSYDQTLKVGPYNFGWRDGGAKNDWVEHYSYRPGLMIWQWDTSQRNNNVGQHPGKGLILPVDAHAKPLKWADGKYITNKIQPYDAAFSWFPNRGFSLHKLGVETKIPAQLGVPVFDDHKGTYWYKENATGSVQTTDTNTRISIVGQPLDGSSITVKVGPSAK
ncbi:immune inhibitor A domain-containing protein [Streptomyces sp. NBC_01446]|uniref:Immune inhibitor A n=1 Tax=Streptomyces sp. NBC_00119 TaxID=2975659 RepID=A0AAU1UDX5_9ACTN|nr:immune inhibitor A domain-containing protein [Streptomyces sp. NBC_01446]MCX4645168.1 immune inhibitor A [Streptomyces sp. NBC_01446]